MNATANHRTGQAGLVAPSRLKELVLGLVLGLSVGTTVHASVDIANLPLFVTANVSPNVMLMLDNSGSMQNIVPDSPYDPDTTYLASCPFSNRVTASTQVETRIVSGNPRIRYSGTNYAFGTNSGQRCFVSSTDYKAKLYADGANGGSTSSYLAAQYTGNYLNWYFKTATDPGGCTNTWSSGRKPCTESRMMIAQTAGKSLVDSMGSGMRVGLSSYNSGNGGSLREILGELTASKKTDIKAKIDALSATGATPLAETLSDIGHYFATGYTGNLTLHPDQASPSTATVAQVFNNHSFANNSGQTIASPIQYSCQKSFAVLLTDGRPQSDRNISNHLADYDGDCDGASPACLTYDRKSNRDYESSGSDYLDDVAQALYEIDLRPDLVDPQGAINNVATYLIGFADDQVKSDPLMQDTADQSGGKFLVAGNEAQLASAFQDILDAIVAQVESSATAAATSSAVLQTDTKLFTSGFRSGDWSGMLTAKHVNADGTVGATAWNAETELNTRTPASRNIYTRNSVTGNGVALVLSDLSPAQQGALDYHPDGSNDALGSNRIGWLRGDESAHASFRSRSGSGTSRLLGDIVNSNPQFVGKRDFGYSLLSTLGSSYTTFRTTSGSDYQLRPDMIYLGANDGMLHAFNADTGSEIFAYMPSELLLPEAGSDFAPVNRLMQQDYYHRYFVDGTATVGDAHANSWADSTSGWKSVLVGTMGAGGRTVFALDVTAPQNFGAGKVLWEFTDDDLGYGVDQPAIVRMRNGDWAAVFGNGYNSNNHHAVLFIVRLSDGALLAKIDTGVGDASVENGLGVPKVTDWPALDLMARTIYAGDLQGNLWRFDVSSGNASQWGNAGNRVVLFAARDPNDDPQPITARPEVAINPNDPGSLMVLFGTGSYFRSSDGGNKQVQSLYGIIDANGTAVTGDRSVVLVEQTITWQGQHAFGTETFTLREISDNAIGTNNEKGWYLDLIYGGNAAGERVVSSPTFPSGPIQDRVRFTTLIPEDDPCGTGRTGFIMDILLGSGGRTSQSVFDLNSDGQFDSSDRVNGVVIINGRSGGSGEELTIIRDQDQNSDHMYDGQDRIGSGLNASGPAGRQSWRQLR
ncbi:pilus assembly protein [Sedimenticola hydrogenitrophicus]|uniref:pilus assembly protein n=1 Tax=Sedimenticola hydrogenitrophicus TaxID=2967975 RepID=UPI0023B0AF6A|nr:PilC/PilY family type IV pilus protein [Sedimenticola hydrogenitrophicus]